MNFVESETCQRMKNLADSLIQHESTESEAASGAAFLDLSAKDLKRYSLVRGIASMVDSITQGVSHFGSRNLYNAPEGSGSHIPMAFSRDAATGFSGLEAECSRTIEKKLGPLLNRGAFFVPSEVLHKRDLTVASGSGGGFLVATKVGSLIEYLRNVSVVFRLGAQRLAGQIGNLSLPKQTGSGTAVWLPLETTQITETNVSFGQVSGTPKTCAIYQEISRQLLKQITPDTEAAVKRGLAEKVALVVDEAALVGTGASGQPLGVLNVSGIGGVTGTSLAYAGLVEAQVDIANANAILNPGTLGYVTTPLIAQTLKNRQRFSGTDSPLWRGAIHEGEIEGARAISTNQMPVNSLLYGDWSSLIIAEWGSLVVEIDPFSGFKTGIVGVRSLWSVDVMVQHPSAFTLISSIT